MRKQIKSAFFIAVGFFFAACVGSDGNTQQNCVPGVTQQCLCLGGTGVQSCSQDGLGFSTCECKSTGLADVTSDGVAPDTVEPTDEGPDQDCQPESYKVCEEGNVVWLDSCGNKGGIFQTCGPNETCSGDTCIHVCTPHDQQYCYKNDIYWYDSCGVLETPSKNCNEDQFCNGCTIEDAPCNDTPNCVKPFYKGTWLLVATPNKQNACGGLVETLYFDQKLVLSVDGTQASGTIEVANIIVNYTGTVTGKKLVLKGSYTQKDLGAPIDHEETIEVEFSSMTEFAGLHLDSYKNFGIPCTVYWDIIGTKQ